MQKIWNMFAASLAATDVKGKTWALLDLSFRPIPKILGSALLDLSLSQNHPLTNPSSSHQVEQVARPNLAFCLPPPNALDCPNWNHILHLCPWMPRSPISFPLHRYIYPLS